MKLDAGTLQVFAGELHAIARSSGLTLRLVPQPRECHGVRLTILPLSSRHVWALGSARVVDGHVVPEIHLYASSVTALLRSTLPALVGRGLARVAAHELGHYLLRTTAHSDDLMSPYYTPARLMAGDYRSFRIPLKTVSGLAMSMDRRHLEAGH